MIHAAAADRAARTASNRDAAALSARCAAGDADCARSRRGCATAACFDANRTRAGAVVLYLITCAQHACRPLKKAALNDHVPHNARGRWNALDGVTRFGWSGSAVLGGYLVDRGGYALTFVVTAATQLIAALVWLALIGRVDPHAAGLVPRRRAPTEDSLEEPLMEDAAPTTRATSGSFVVDDYSEMPRG